MTTDPGQQLRIRVPAGIGDFSWIWSKVGKLPDLHVEIAPEKPNRTEPFVSCLLPSARVAYGGFQGIESVRGDVAGQHRIEHLDELRGSPPLFLSANAHLEAGHSLDSWLPGMEADYHYEIPHTGEDEAKMRHVVGNAEIPYVFGFYTSSYRTNEAWRFWTAEDWRDLALSLEDVHPNARYVLIGADFDADLGGAIEKLLLAEGLDVVTTWNPPLYKSRGQLHVRTVAHVLRHLSYLFAFPSGIGVLGGVVRCPTTMFMPPHLEKMIGTFTPDDELAEGVFRNVLFEGVGDTLAWLLDRTHLVRRVPKTWEDDGVYARVHWRPKK